MERNYNFSTFRFLLLFLLGTLLISGCSFNQVDASTFTATIGDAGGTIDTGTGVVVSIPQGAVPKRTKIQVKPYLDPSELPESIGKFAIDRYSVIELLPDGLTLQQPVSITIPATHSLTPGLEFPLYYWNKDETYWEVTDFIATVNEDGESYTADVTHFSSYSGGGEGTGGGMYSGFDPEDIPCESDQSIVDWHFNNWIADLATAEGVYGVGHGMPDKGCCKEVSGVEIILRFSKCGINYEPLEQVFGDTTDADEILTYPLNKVVDPSTGFFLFQEIKLYLKRVAPYLSLDSVSTCMDLSCSEDGKDEQYIELRTVCGTNRDVPLTAYAVALEGAQIEWLADGVGKVDPEMGFTDSSGEAHTTLTVEEKGLTRLLATARTCQGTEEFNEKKVRSDMICVDDCDKMSLNLTMTLTHSGEELPWSLTDNITAYIEYTIDEETGNIIPGESQGSQSVSIVSNTDHCQPTQIKAPDFRLKIVDGYVTEGTTNIELMAETLPLDFTFRCNYEHFEEPVEVTVPPYSALLGSVMGKHLELELPGRCQLRSATGFVKGDGSEGFGESPAIQYSYTASLSCVERECKMCQ